MIMQRINHEIIERSCVLFFKILLEYEFFSEMLKQGTWKLERLQRYACLNTELFFFGGGGGEGGRGAPQKIWTPSSAPVKLEVV